MPAGIAKEENNQGTAPPISIPTKTCGTETRIPAARAVGSTRLTSVIKEPKRETAAITADPIAIPLVIALVVLPTASRSAIIWRAATVSLSSCPCQAISPIPLALSEIGPKESMATLLPVRVSIPMPVIATPYKIKVNECTGSEEIPPKIRMEAKIVAAMTIIDQTEDSNPADTPDKINVAGPVSAALLISLTGVPWEPVEKKGRGAI